MNPKFAKLVLDAELLGALSAGDVRGDIIAALLADNMSLLCEMVAIPPRMVANIVRVRTARQLLNVATYIDELDDLFMDLDAAARLLDALQQYTNASAGTVAEFHTRLLRLRSLDWPDIDGAEAVLDEIDVFRRACIEVPRS